MADCSVRNRSKAACVSGSKLTSTACCRRQVSLPVVRRFVARVEERALGTAVLKGVKPEQQLVKVVNDALIDLMGGSASGLVEGGPGRPQVLPGCYS